jgi:hypothetical protein
MTLPEFSPERSTTSEEEALKYDFPLDEEQESHPQLEG